MKFFTIGSVIALTLAAALHVLRLALDWNLVIGGRELPMWTSIVSLPVFAGLAIGLWLTSRSAASAETALTENELTGLLGVNSRGISMSGALLRNIFPPGLAGKEPEHEKAWKECVKFAEVRGFTVSPTGAPRSDTITFAPKA